VAEFKGRRRGNRLLSTDPATRRFGFDREARMLLHLDTSWLLMTVASVAVFGFFFGSALDAIMQEDGFGSTGNTLLFTLGFFVAIMVANEHGIVLRDLKLAVAWGLGGAFAFIGALALLKAGLARL
jgi:hypothetical protein